MLSAEAKLRVETICFLVFFTRTLWQKVSKLCSFTRRSGEEFSNEAMQDCLGCYNLLYMAAKKHKDS